jgi:hypothetical protein
MEIQPCFCLLVIRINVIEVMDGLEPPWKVLQTRASPLGHMTNTAAK